MENTLLNIETTISVNTREIEALIEKRIRLRFPKNSVINTNKYDVVFQKEYDYDEETKQRVLSKSYYIRFKINYDLTNAGYFGSLSRINHSIKRVRVEDFSNEAELIANIDKAIDELIANLKADKAAMQSNTKKYFNCIDSIK